MQLMNGVERMVDPSTKGVIYKNGNDLEAHIIVLLDVFEAFAKVRRVLIRILHNRHT